GRLAADGQQGQHHEEAEKASHGDSLPLDFRGSLVRSHLTAGRLSDSTAHAVREESFGRGGFSQNRGGAWAGCGNSTGGGRRWPHSPRSTAYRLAQEPACPSATATGTG